MAVREKTLELFKRGMTPGEISRHRGVSIQTTLPYLNELVGRGRIRRSDIYFSVPSEVRQSISGDFEKSGLAARDFVASLRKHGHNRRADDAEVVLEYGDTRAAFGDMYQDLRAVELALHDLVRAGLEAVGSEWWQMVPPGVRSECERRRARDPRPAQHLFNYTDLSGLRDIIIGQWSFISSRLPKALRHKQLLRSELAELKRIRNAIMHPVKGVQPTEQDFDRVLAFRRKLIANESV
jgi:hypothetical protein